MSSSILWRISLLAFWLTNVHAAGPTDYWPLQPVAATAKTQAAAVKDVPSSLQPAVQFQRVYCDIIAGTSVTNWRGELERLASLTGEDPVNQGVRDVARLWLARVAMQDIDAALRNYYRQHVEFPAKLPDLPEKLRVDPWGQPWVYALHAPRGFEKQTNQRYRLGPTRAPQLSSLREAIQKRPAVTIPWKIVAKDTALQYKSAVTSAIIQPGGTVDNCTLLFMGAGWGLMATAEQLFAVTY